ncbi:vWA domain-containing protein [Roseibacillus persicicus]|uniref:vWA domain-containing protein n=1 Tax=Roseibacillus persicicus TaxID=454148 RepID=UPI0028103C34|nr:VWA domain-containing protein [Roseibacillus persicicus]MDQ8188673.1 VWA domain-containing protein [Roseibacillus persicicus]
MNVINTFSTAVALLFAGHLSAQEASLEAPEMGIVDETVKVLYSGPGNEGDEMTIGDARGIELRGTNPADLSDGKGSVNLLMPSLPGLYTIIYRGEAGVLTTENIQVTNPEFGVRVADSATASGSLPVFWSGVNQGGAVIALRNTDGSVLDSAALPANQTSGSVRIQLPIEAGPYEVSYIIGDNIKATRAIQVTAAEETNLFAPPQVMANTKFQAVFSGPFNDRDRIVVVKAPASADSEIMSYAYLNPYRGTAVLNAPESQGLYEIQYRNRSNEVLASDTFEVLAADRETGTLSVVALENYQLKDDSAMEVILDASGSMLQDQEGEDRIDIAKDTLLKFMQTSVPEGMTFSLRAFGHIEEGSCESELLIPSAPFDYAGMAPIVKEVEAINLAKTPLAKSIEMVSSDLKGTEGERVVVLLTDGEETCDGSPAAAIRSLVDSYPNTRVNIVGYNIGDEEVSADFESWATLGNGRYFRASEAESLTVALRKAAAIPFSVYQGTRLVASGLSGDSSFELPAGTYEIAFFNNGKEVRKAVVVAGSKEAAITIP